MEKSVEGKISDVRARVETMRSFFLKREESKKCG